MAGSNLKDVLPLDRPPLASPDDIFKYEDELGNRTYETPFGTQYTIRPATKEEIAAREPLPVKAKKWLKDGANLPSGQQVLDVLKSMPKEMFNTVDRTMKGEGTVGDLLDTVGMIAASPATNFSRAGKSIPSLDVPKYQPSYQSLKAESDLMLGGAPDYVDLQDLFSTPLKSPDEYFDEYAATIKKDVEEPPKNPLYATDAQLQKEVLDAVDKEKLLKLAEDLPHFEDPNYGNYIKTEIKDFAKNVGVQPSVLQSMVSDLNSYFPQKKNPALQTLAEAPLPEKAPIGPRANALGKERPSDKKAEALGFKDTVYHTASGGKDFNLFDLDRTIDDGVKAPQDYLGVHVGTPRAAAERNYSVDSQIPEGARGFTMELRARTDKPFTGKDLVKLLGASPEDYPTGLEKGAFSEYELGEMISSYEDKLFSGANEVPRNSRELAAKALRKDLAKEGYTHIPYINDVEDPGSISYIMLTDRPKDSPAVLRDVRAKFDPKKITNPDLRFAEGGAVENVDPISGNPVPTGSLPEEVRDDVDAKLSQGEYVLPADVVRFFGLAQIESLVTKAKQGLAEMESKGRIGGQQEEDLPFSPEDLQAVDDTPAEPVAAPTEPQMAEGGLVLPTDPNTARTGLILPPVGTPDTNLPDWMLQFGNTPDQAPNPIADSAISTPKIRPVGSGTTQAERDANKPTGLAGSINTWKPADFVNYAGQRNSPVNKGIQTAIGMAIPFGGVMAKARENYLEKNVPKTMEQMLQTGKDLEGKALSSTDITSLQKAYDEIKAEPMRTSGLAGRLISGIQTALGSKDTPNYKSTTSSGGASNKTVSFASAPAGNRPTISATKAPSTLKSSSSSSKTVSKQPTVSGGKPGLSAGGLIKKRNK